MGRVQVLAFLEQGPLCIGKWFAGEVVDPFTLHAVIVWRLVLV